MGAQGQQKARSAARLRKNGVSLKRQAGRGLQPATVKAGLVQALPPGQTPQGTEGRPGFQPSTAGTFYEVQNLPPECDWQPGDYVTFPASGDDAENRYKVFGDLRPVIIDDVLTRYDAFLVSAPDTE